MLTVLLTCKAVKGDYTCPFAKELPVLLGWDRSVGSIPTLASNRKVFGDKELRGVERPLSVKMSVKWRLK